jgi:hypothetical protein
LNSCRSTIKLFIFYFSYRKLQEGTLRFVDSEDIHILQDDGPKSLSKSLNTPRSLQQAKSKCPLSTRTCTYPFILSGNSILTNPQHHYNFPLFPSIHSLHNLTPTVILRLPNIIHAELLCLSCSHEATLLDIQGCLAYILESVRETKEQTHLRVYGVRPWLRREQPPFDSILARMDCGWGWGLWDLLDCWLKKRLRRRSNCKEKKYVWSSTLLNLGI